ncbi:hypothetical protein EGP98_03070 [bacterium]|nr:hypothetical protein [bacterium]
MNLKLQIISVAFSFFYGIFLSFLISLQYKFLFESKRIIRIIGNFVFSLDMALIYFIIMKRINYGEIHIIFYILIFLGYIFSYRKIQLFVSRILKRP